MGADRPARESRGGDEDVVVRKGERGWVVRGEEVSDLASAMVLADLFAADQEEAAAAEAATFGATGFEGAGFEGTAYAEGRPAGSGAPPTRPERPQPVAGQPSAPRPRFIPQREIEAEEAQRLAVTVTQLEHALASRVRVEQAIGVLAERHRLRPREAFDLLRGAARARGQKITAMAQDVVASTANPLLLLPEELARQAPAPKQRSRSPRRLFPTLMLMRLAPSGPSRRWRPGPSRSGGTGP